MEGSHTGWWRRHGWTIAILLASIGVSFAIRTIWTYPVVAQYGWLYTYAGGSDSYYHSRVTTYIILNHSNLVYDPLLHYPLGSTNPREPLFDWMNAILGLVFAPAFGGNAVSAGAFFLDLQAPLWAALGVVPVYLIGREVSGRRMGLIAAVIYPFLSANIDSSTFGYANYLSFYTFFVLVTIYCYLRLVKSVGSRRWIDSYAHPREFVPGIRNFLRTEQTAVKWAVFTGVSLGALALAWQGYTLAVVVIGVSVLVAVFVERIRRVDSLGLYVVTWIVGLVAFPMELPYYLAQYGSVTSPGFETYFLLQAIIFFGVLLVLLPFMLMRDIPWVLSIPILVGIVAAGVAGLYFVDRSLFTTLTTGQGYFVKTLVYSTVAEAQAPSIDALVIGFGIVTFFLAFVGVALFLYQLIRGRFKRHHIVFVVFAIVSIYLPISATKFFLVASPIFALLPAEVIRRLLDVAGYGELRRTTASLSDRRSQFSAFRRAFKARHVLVMALVIGLILPNIWVAIDAGIPGNTKSGYAQQVSSTLPSWLQLNTSSPTSYYFGAAGSSLDTPNQYDSAGYNWLATQDTNLAPPQRPAVDSWWDYGFQTIDQGQHPSVADNFQDGIDPAGQFLLAQNESLAIGVMTTTLLASKQVQSHSVYLTPALNRILAADGLNVSQLHNLLANTSADYRLVVGNPGKYLPVDSGTLTDANAMYIATSYFLADSLTLSGVAKVYNDVQAYTGWTIGYGLSDTRLFPFSGTDTGIYYAPVELTGRVVDGAGVPLTYFNVTVSGSDGGTYPLGSLPSSVSALGYNINYFAPFYNSMIYHIYIGYNGTDVGLGTGIPGLEGSEQLLASPLMPGWMLQHFQVVYQTAYYCPKANVSLSSSCLSAVNLPDARAHAVKHQGTVDTSAQAYFEGGESFLEYYPGQTLIGTVTLPNGAPVPGAQVTVLDSNGIPHMTTHATADGSFSVVLPPGNDTLNITTGPQNLLLQQGTTLLKSVAIEVPNAIGMSLDAPTRVETFTVDPATVQGFVYWNSNNSTVFEPANDPLVPGAEVLLWGANGTARISAVTDASGSFNLPNVPPGSYNLSVIYGGQNYTRSPFTVAAGGTYNATSGLTPGFLTGTVTDPSGASVAGVTVALSNATGVVATTVTNSSGGYKIASTGPGNYTLWAYNALSGERSAGALVSLAGQGSSVVTPLTLRTMTTITFPLVANGAPAADIPVRFVPVALSGNSSSAPIQALLNSTAAGTVVTSTAAGTVSVALPSGTYSVYALGFVGGKLTSAVSSVTVGPLQPTILPALALAPAATLSGAIKGLSTAPSDVQTAIVVYAPGGGEAVTWATSGGKFSLLVPAGTYSLSTLTGTATATASGVTVSLASVAVVAPNTTVEVAPVTAVSVHFAVGLRLADGLLYPASGALATLSAPAIGAAVPAIADVNGTESFYVPAAVPGGGGYCLAAQSFGFVAANECDLSATDLSELSTFPLALANVTTNLVLVGLPAGTTATVNFTAESSTAVGRTITGVSPFSLTLSPGVYGVGALAKITGSTSVYLPPSILSTTIPLGATYSNLTLLLIPKITSKGTLVLPSGVSPATVNVTLSSSTLGNLTVNGTTYTQGFYAAPGEYSVSASYTSSGTNYTNLTRVTAYANGTISPSIRIDTAGIALEGTFQSGTATIPLTTSVAVVASTGARTTAPATNGRFSVTVPPGGDYAIFANGTLLASGPNGSFYRAYHVAPGARCTANGTACTVPVVGVDVPWWLNATVASSGLTSPLAGTATLVGPYPYANVTVVPYSGGSFSVRVAPGAYSVYVNGTGAANGLATFGSALALPSVRTATALTLVPTWVATVSASGPGGSWSGVSAVTLALRNAAGQRIVFPDLAPGASVSFPVPAGTYVASASAVGSVYGTTVNLTGSVPAAVVRGNVAFTVPLSYPISYSVAGTLVGPASATLRAGSNATFAFTVRATGTSPVTITPVGTPSFWTFTFNFASATLVPGPTGTILAGEVTVHVPAGTAVAHPGVTIEFEAPNGTVVGSVAPTPTIHVVPTYGVVVGAPSTTASEIGVDHLLQPFYVVNTGNTLETVAFSVVNEAQLATAGWKAVIVAGTTAAAASVSLAAGQNETLHVQLNATSAIFLPPGAVVVNAEVLNVTGSVSASAKIPIPLATVHPSAPPTVTGPSIGSPPPYPDWFVPAIVFVPAAGLILAVFTYRWWRTRRWRRR